jgi:hypothetical protein
LTGWSGKTGMLVFWVVLAAAVIGVGGVKTKAAF